METIDLSTWSRTHLFNAYYGTDFPYINIGCELDVTNLYKYCKQENISFYFSFAYIATKLSNEIENFRYRFKDENPFIIDKNIAALTHIPKDSEIFQQVFCDDYDNMKDYAVNNRAKAEIILPESGLPALKGRYDYINFTCIPWIYYTHFVRTIAKDGMDCNPKMSIGKIKHEGGKTLIPFSSQTHHGLMDGYHVGKFFNSIEEYLIDEGWK